MVRLCDTCGHRIEEDKVAEWEEDSSPAQVIFDEQGTLPESE
jgi:hypothetical protein